MDDQQQQRHRRRRGRRGGQGRPREEAQRPQGPPPGPPGPPGTPPPARPLAEGAEPRRPRQDTRRGKRDGAPAAPGANGAPASRIHRREPEEAPPRDRRGGVRDMRGRERPPRERDYRPRTYEAPIPQDEHSIELGRRFREAQTALRDAKRTLEKRRAEQGDEPQWLIDEYESAERRFEEAATAWSEHLATTGRKVAHR